MLFRYRHYRVVPEKTALFNDFFQKWLLPIQLRHGAQLVGRWQTEDGSEIIALWAYESTEAYHAIERQVRDDPQSVEAQRYRWANLDPLVTEVNQQLMFSTLPLHLTTLAHLDRGTNA